jgi:hypothetical protein
MQQEIVLNWCYEAITVPQLEITKNHVLKDAADRKAYLESAFTQVIIDLQGEIQALQAKMLLGDTKGSEKIAKKEERIVQLMRKKQARLVALEESMQLSAIEPQILGCAYVVPLTQIEYKQHYGMSRDVEAEKIAMQFVMDYEISEYRTPTDVSAQQEGYDIRSVSAEGLKRYIEVKGRSGADGSVMVSENEMNRLAQLGDSAWLYIVVQCKSNPTLFRWQNPAKNLIFEQKTKGIQYFLPMSAWK